jgi:hypothetical protein
MSDPNIKQIQLVSSGPQEGGTRKREKKPKKKFEIPSVTKTGGAMSPGTTAQLVSSHVPSAEKPVEPVGVNSALTQKALPLPIQKAGAASNPVKVILGEIKKLSKVVLAAGKGTKPTTHTRKNKVARKVRVSMVSLSRKIGKAKDIRAKASGDKIDEIKKSLQKAGLIKAESKAPETMLRQMYADFMMLKKRAL